MGRHDGRGALRWRTTGTFSAACCPVAPRSRSLGCLEPSWEPGPGPRKRSDLAKLQPELYGRRRLHSQHLELSGVLAVEQPQRQLVEEFVVAQPQVLGRRQLARLRRWRLQLARSAVGRASQLTAAALVAS